MRVLVVDDDAVVLDLVTEQLAEHEILAHTAQGIAEALEMAEREVLDLILTDVRMAPPGGDVLLASMLERTPETPVVLMSSYSPPGSPETARKAGAAGFLRKPFTANQLLAAINSALCI